MKYKLLSVSKSPKLVGINIGDYIQALAAAQFYPHIDGFIDRDEDLKDYDGEPCKVIMNGWYMHNPENWPPSKKIVPLFVAFHLNVLAQKELLSSPSVAYLKQFVPIGCRDLNTRDLLNKYGVDAYFSGCMTLTLGEKYHSEGKEDKTYIVDPLFNGPLDVSNILKAILEIFSHFRDIYKLYHKEQFYIHHGRNWIKKILKTALYYHEYRRVFSRDVIMTSTYICQESDYYAKQFKSDFERLNEAERLVRLYAKARLVITSRIHCALPCLGLETPVIYLEKTRDIAASSCRLGGLHDLFNVIKIDNGILVPEFKITTPITMRNIPVNKDSWRPYAEALKSRCKEFMNR